ncbi:hypothetical protein FRB95_005168 [Tulasnella sp. JGI-2019a]|nr:hypothetical protein FRB95_005168 [Tulasnella sp. JGI-2019a]
MNLELLGPSMDQVIDILLASPALVDLALASLYEESHHVIVSNSRTVQLSYLHNLSLASLPAAAILLLFRTLHIPNCVNLDVDLKADRSGTYEAVVREAVPAARKIVLAAGSDPRIEITPNHISALNKNRGARMKIGVELSGGFTIELVESIVSVFQSPRTHQFARVTVSVPQMNVSRSTIIPILRSSLHTWKLVLQPLDPLNPGASDTALEFLAGPIGDGAARWPAPDLEVIMLGHLPENLLDMIIRRYGRVEDVSKSGQSVERPSALRILDVRAPFTVGTSLLVEKLTGVLGGGIVHWNRGGSMQWLDDADAGESRAEASSMASASSSSE